MTALAIQDINLNSRDFESIFDYEMTIPDGYQWAYFGWDNTHVSKKIQISNFSQEETNTHVTVVNGTGFKTILGDNQFEQGGLYFYQVKVLQGSLIKIGVCRRCDNLESAFCDSNDGWALYDGQLRHGSNSTGEKYGRKIHKNSVVGVMLDTIKGTLSFTIDGEFQGTAFSDETFKRGVFVPAVSLIYAGDSVRLIQPFAED